MISCVPSHSRMCPKFSTIHKMESHLNNSHHISRHITDTHDSMTELTQHTNPISYLWSITHKMTVWIQPNFQREWSIFINTISYVLIRLFLTAGCPTNKIHWRVMATYVLQICSPLQNRSIHWMKYQAMITSSSRIS